MTVDPASYKATQESNGSHFAKSEEAWDVYRLLVENSYDLVGELDVGGEYVYVNPSYFTSLGYAQKDLLQRSAFDYIHPQDQAKARREFQQQDGTTILRFKHQNGTWKWFDCSFRQFGTENGTRTVLISRDVSARKEEEIKFDVLASLGSRLSAAKSQVEAARVVADAAAVLCGWDAFSLDLYDPEMDVIHPVLMIDEINGKKTEIMPEYESRAPSPLVRNVFQSGPQRILRKGNDFDAALRPFGDITRASASLMFVPIVEEGRPLGMVTIQSYRINAFFRSDLKLMQVLAGHCSGTLARIRAVDALAESQARFEAFMENTPAAAWIKDEFGRYIYANQTIESLYNKTRDDVLQKTDGEFLQPELAREMQKEDEEVRHSGQPLRVEQTLTPKSSRRWFMCKFPFFSPKGGWYVGGLAFDVTDQAVMQRSLRASEEKFRILFESAPMAIALVQQDELLYTNSSYRRMFGIVSEAATAGRSFLEDIAHAHRKEIERYMKQEGGDAASLKATEVLARRNGGAEFPCLIQMAPVEMAEGRASLVFIIDVSEKRALENQLFQSQKMESIGRLAGGIAHDFANLLTVIQGHAARLERGAQNPAASLDGIIRSANKATELTKQLLAFSRKQTLQLAETDLNEAVSQVSRMMERVLGENIALRVHLSPRLPQVHADKNLIEQLILNLSLAARDSMGAGGNLTMATSYLAAKSAPAGPGWERGAVCLEIQDTGRGVSREDMPHIFEPFFKERTGSQSSLRLATVYGIVKQHNGQIDVQSDLGSGTRYKVLFPAMGIPAPAMSEDLFGNPSETILIVEDSADLRGLVRQVLNDAGYQTMEASSVAGALKLFEGARDRVALVLADVFLEDGSGREVVRKIRAAKPSVHAILTTGYDPHQVKGQIGLRENERFLAKPFTNEELLELVQSCLRR